MKKVILFVLLFGSLFANADGKASVITDTNFSAFPPASKCLLRYSDKPMTVGMVLQLIEVQPTLGKNFRSILDIKNERTDDFLIRKSVEFLKINKMKISDCSNVGINDLFSGVGSLNNCSNQEKLVAEINKVDIPHENFNFSDRCRESSSPSNVKVQSNKAVQ